MALIPTANAGPYWVGDTPAPLTLSYETADGEPVTLAPGVTVTAALRVLGIHGTQPLTSAVTGNTVTVTFPPVSLLGIQGVYDIETTISGATTTQAEPFSFVVQDHDGWLTLYQARRRWSDAPTDDVLLWGLLDSARRACTTFAPVLPVDDDGDIVLPLPAGYPDAQLMQARNTWNAAKTDPATTGDGEMFVIRPYPLDNFIKQLLRPRTGTPAVG